MKGTHHPFKSPISILIVLVVFLILIRLFAPVLLTTFANHKLALMDGINGSISSIDMDVYRGAYTIHGTQLYLQKNVPESKTIAVQKLDISLSWSALLNGSIVSAVHVDGATITLFDEKAKENSLSEEAMQPETWLTLIEFASPISIDEVVISNSQLALTLQADKKLDTTSFSDVFGKITNITNSSDFTGNKVARFEVVGLLDGSAKTKVFGSINPDTRLPTFDINLEMEKLSIEKIDPLISFYTPLDIEAGEIDVAIELASTNGNVQGYTKAGVYNVDIFSWQQDINNDGDSVFTGILEGGADIIASIFSDGEKDLVAVNVPITGTLDNTDVSVWDALTSLFYNAFVDAYDIKIDDSVDYHQSEEK